MITVTMACDKNETRVPVVVVTGMIAVMVVMIITKMI